MVITLTAKFTSDAVTELWQHSLPEVRRLQAGAVLQLDADHVEEWDSAGEAYVLELYRCAQQQGFTIQCQDQKQMVSDTLQRFNVDDYIDKPVVSTASAWHWRGLVKLGIVASQVGQGAVNSMAFFGELVAATLGLLVGRGRVRLRDLLLHFERAGSDALPIVILIGFLLGVILAFMSAMAFRRFGVEIYVSDLIAIGLFRELGALVTAIILAGRSSSAFAAELSSMKLNEEVDALRTMGLPPVTFLALPRIWAAVLVMPLLTIFTILAGLVGGVLVLLSIGVPPVIYWQHVVNATPVSNIVLGLCKAALFGLLAGCAGCARGLLAKRTPDAVGRAATSAVVDSLILITVADGVMAVLCYITGV